MLTKVSQPNVRPEQTNRSAAFFQPVLQRKPDVSSPGDEWEREADAVAEKVMRMPAPETDPFFKPAPFSPFNQSQQRGFKTAGRSALPAVQRQPEGRLPAPDLSLHASAGLLQPATTPDFLSMRQPFFNRGVLHLWDPDSALQVWQYNFNFFRRLGLTPDLSVSLTNFTAPRFIDSQLKANNPTWWELTDRELNTSTLGASLPVLDFNADFSPVAPSWFRTLFGRVQRKEAPGQEASSVWLGAHFTGVTGAGDPLRAKDRQFFEPRMGLDLSGVRIHTGSGAAEAAKSIRARAYTQGQHIVFAEGQYHPESAEGKQLMAHELAHVAQQQPGMLLRRANPRPTTATDLASYSEANRRRLVLDTDSVALDPTPHFQQGIVETPRAGFDLDYVFAGAIDSWLRPPLRSMARALFALQQHDTDPVIVNATLIKHLDLRSFHEGDVAANPAGPDTRFRFTCEEFDATTTRSGGGRHRIRNLQLIIENIGPAPAIAHAGETAAQRIVRFQQDYNFYRSDSLFFSDDDFDRVLRAVSLVPDAILRSISGTPFNRIAGQATGANGEAAEYSWTLQNGTYTRVINIYDDALRQSTTAESLAFLMTHEIGHAVAHRPAEATGVAAQSDLSAETGRGSFREAATTDGGLQNAVTVYGRTGWGEYFAEAFSLFIHEPETLRLLRPHVFAYFNTRFPPPATP